MSTTHVFSGPSLPADRVCALLPGARHRPPVRHGDLVALDPAPGDRVVLLDGVFQQSASVRHKEITGLLAAGVEVWGASSMGALRAAELDVLGVRGAGTVYRLFAGGLLERDDEVALVHTDAEDGSRPLTVALVSIRVLMRALRRHGRVSPAAEAAIVGTADALPFPDRTWPHVLSLAGVDAADREAVLTAVRVPDRAWDVKTRDAVRLLARLARTRPAPPATTDVPVTTHVERWRRRVRPAEERLVTAAALHAHDYPDLHRRTVLNLVGEGAPGTDPLDRAVAAARARGLVGPSDTDTDTNTDAAAVAQRLVDGFRWPGGLAPLGPLAAAVAASPGGAGTRALVASAERLNDGLAARGRAVAAVSRATVLRHVARRWHTGDLAAAAVARGFRDLDELVDRLRWLVPQLVLDPPAPLVLGPRTATPAPSLPTVRS